MLSRLVSMMPLMSDDCTVSVAIDDYEMVRMSEMMTETFANHERKSSNISLISVTLLVFQFDAPSMLVRAVAR